MPSERPATPGAAASPIERIERIEHALQDAVGQVVGRAEQSLARRFGTGCVRWLRLTVKAAAMGLVLALFAFGIALLATRYIVMPRIDEARPWLERTAGRALGTQVRIGSIQASWRGFNPHLRLADVRLLDAQGAATLTLPQLEATIGWRSAVLLSLRLHSLSIVAPELEVRRRTDGGFAVAGFNVAPGAGGGDGRGLDWLLAQRRIAIRDARVRLVDEGNAPAAAVETVFDDVSLLLDNGLASHRFALRARPPSELAGPIDVRGEFAPPLLERRGDFSRWQGRLFMQFDFVDLARAEALARLLPAGMQIEQAHGALRAWVDVDRLQVRRVRADVALHEVVARLAPDLDPMRLASMQGRYTQQVWGDELDGGQEIRLEGFSLHEAAGAGRGPLLPPTDLRWRTVRATGTRAARHEFEAGALELDTLARLAQHLPQLREAHEALARHALRGRLSAVAARWEGSLPQPARYSLRTRFDGLASIGRAAAASGRAPAGLPGFENLSGALEADESSGTLTLDSRNARIQFPGVFDPERLDFDRLRSHLRWTLGPVAELRIESLRATNGEVDLSASGSWRAGGRGLGLIDLGGRIEHAAAATAHRYVPLVAGAGTRAWLRQALVAGEAYDGSFRVRGDLREFPFVDPNRGEFRVQARLRGGTLDYLPAVADAEGRSRSAWPAITGIEGELLFDRQRMQITGRRAGIYGVRLTDVTARIADLKSGAAHLLVEGQAAGPLSDMLRYVNASPVGGLLGGFLGQASGSGEARLDLALDIALAQPRETAVKGTLRLAGNDVTLRPDLPPMTRASGRIEFSERSLQVREVTAGFVGGQVRIDGSRRADGAIALTATGTATPAGVRRLVDVDLVQRLLDRAQGSARYHASLVMRGSRPELRVESDLAGWRIDAAEPLRKATEATLPLHIEWVPEAARPFERDTLAVRLGDLFVLRHERSRDAATGLLRVERGVVGVGAAAMQAAAPRSGVRTVIELPRLDLDPWLPLFADRLDGADRGSAATTPLPDALAARIEHLTIAGKPFRNVVLGATRAGDGVWQANVVADPVDGHISWRPASANDAGGLRARLARLSIPKAEDSTVVDLLDAAPTQVPALDLIVDEFEIEGHRLGRLEVVANNVGSGPTAAWRLRQLELRNPDATLTGQGQWMREPGTGTRRMTLDLKLEYTNAGALLARLGTKDALRGGSGTLEGEVSWRGSPLAIDYATLGGSLALAASKGQFLKAEPGAGRLLGVVSLQALPRRITLDFRDVFSEGFAFDSIGASAQLKAGVLTTRDFRMEGASAKVLIEGAVDLRRETQDLHVLVLPESLVGSTSLAVALLANPALGLGAFVAQMLLKDPLAKAMAYEFDVTGAWKDPQVSRRTRPGPKTPPATEIR